jgi:putative endonuclease
MFYTYVIQSKKDKRFYTGFTKDLRKRFYEHNSGKVHSTKNRSPFELIYYEACLNEQDAIAREKYLKSGMGKRYLKNRLERFLSLTGSMAPPEPKHRRIGFRREKESE